MKPVEALLAPFACSLILALPAPAHADAPLLEPEAAFLLAARAQDGGRIEVRFDIAPDYYLYRNRLQFSVNGVAVPPAQISLPKGKVTRDPTFGRVETYHQSVHILLAKNTPGKAGNYDLVVSAQGCAAKAGVCFPAHRQQIRMDINSDWTVPASHPAPATFPSAASRFTKP